MKTERQKLKILTVDDKLEIGQLIRRILDPYYRVCVAVDVTMGEEVLRNEACDLVLLDINFPGDSGLRLCEKIKSDPLLRHIPVILVTAMDTSEDTVKGLKIGADDFVAKPFKKAELLARIESVLRRTSMSLEANPLSRLPGNVTIEKEIIRRIESRQKFSVLYADINHFKAYNDYYGFSRGDQVIKKTADILLKNSKGQETLVGHIGGDDFVMIAGEENLQNLCQRIVKDFDSMVPSLYDPKEREAGFIVTTDRQEKIQKFPLLSLAIGVVSNVIRPIESLGEVATMGAELKSFAKKHAGSYYAIERRTEKYPEPACNKMPVARRRFNPKSFMEYIKK